MSLLTEAVSCGVACTLFEHNSVKTLMDCLFIGMHVRLMPGIPSHLLCLGSGTGIKDLLFFLCSAPCLAMKVLLAWQCSMSAQIWVVVKLHRNSYSSFFVPFIYFCLQLCHILFHVIFGLSFPHMHTPSLLHLGDVVSLLPLTAGNKDKFTTTGPCWYAMFAQDIVVLFTWSTSLYIILHMGTWTGYIHKVGQTDCFCCLCAERDSPAACVDGK